MPPVTPSRTRMAGSALRRRQVQLALVDLVQRDGQRLVGRLALHERADVLQQALGELGVVGVDLARALGGVDHQGVLGVGPLQQAVDGGVGDAFGAGNGTDHVEFFLTLSQGPTINDTSSLAARATSSLTMTMSNSSAAASWVRAVSSRARRSSALSVPRRTSRCTSSSQLGGARKTNSASGIRSRT